VTYVLVTAEEIQGIPATVDGFAEFASIARDAYWRSERELGPNDSNTQLEQSFMSQVSAAAYGYDIPWAEDLDIDKYINNGFESGLTHDFAAFNRELHKIMTRLQIARAREAQTAQLALSDNAKSKVRFHIQQLRDRIDESALPQVTKDRLHKRLDELAAELSGKRLNLAAIMVGITGLFGALGVVEADLVKLPDTIAAIGRVLDEAQQYHDRLTAPVKRLAPPTQPSKTPAPAQRLAFTEDLDDEIPF
jgi:hypothetical protein